MASKGSINDPILGQGDAASLQDISKLLFFCYR
jgi:hypothetical protein